MPGIPLGDPQFWIVTGATLAVLAWALLRLRRSLRSSEKPGCSKCAAAPARPEEDSDRSAASRRLGLLLAAFALAGPGLALASEPVERIVEAMGTTLSIRIEGLPRSEALTLSQELIAAVARIEADLSTWRDDSELARLNRQPVGVPLVLSGATWDALAEAVRCSIESAGAFDPTVGPLVEAWDLRGAGRVPRPEELERARARVGLSGLALDRSTRSATRLADVVVEEGGFGKGAALEAALVAARTLSPDAGVRLNFGGQLAWTGLAEPLAVEIADPRHRGRGVLLVATGRSEGSVSTSAGSERVRRPGRTRIGHLLDPRTGRPAPDFGSATAIAAEATRADCLSTGLYVLGPAAGRHRVGAGPAAGDQLLVIVDGEQLRALVPARLRGRVEALVPELRIEYVDGSSS